MIPIFTRGKGVLMAVPLDLIPQETLTSGLNAQSGDLVGPSLVVRCPAVQESENGEELPLGAEISCLLVDFAEEVLPLMREYDPVTDQSTETLHFWPELPETLPSSVSLQEQALEWISQESDSRVHFYSAEEAEVVPKFVQPAPKKIVLKPEAPLKTLAEQLAALSDALPSITTQLELLQNNQAKLESALNRPQVASQAAHKLDFPVPLGNANLDVKGFASAVGPPPRTNFSTPLRHQARETLPEDEPMLDPQQDGFRPFQLWPVLLRARHRLSSSRARL